MKRTTRQATLDDVRDLLQAAPRAYRAFDEADDITATPVDLVFQGGRYLITVRYGAPAGWPRPGQAVMLLVDDGHYTLDLRGARIRGRLGALVEPLPEQQKNARRFELLPERVIAWDYGKMRARDSGDVGGS